MVPPSFSALPDDKLLALARSGEDDAWAELLRRYHPVLLRFLTGAVGDPEEAANLAQDTWLDAARDLDRLAFDRPFVPWLYRIARNNLLPYWRRRSRLQISSLESVIEEGEADIVTVSLRDSDDDVASVVAADDLLREALEGLSPLLREALLLHEVQGLTAREMAETLGLSRVAAEQRITRAAKQFWTRYNALRDDGRS